MYGGGGIMPDIFVPLDTTVYTKYYRNLSRKNIIINTYMQWYDNNRKRLGSQYKDFDKYRATFEVPQELIDSIVSKGVQADVKAADDDELQHTVARLRLQLKALVARDLWDTNEYYAIMNEENDIVKRALQLLQDS